MPDDLTELSEAANIKSKEIAKSFDDIWNAELSALEQRRRSLFDKYQAPGPQAITSERAYKLNVFGVALSGGGIRSATLNLGILQGLTEKGLLPYVDYLSTISGGGYIGTWLHSVICRKNSRDPRQTHVTLNRRIPGQPEDDPIAFLRKYSNYLAPKLGLFSADFWVIFTIWIRNMLLNLLILIPFLASLVTVAVIIAPWAADGIKNAPDWNYLVGGVASILLLLAVITAARNLNAISLRQFASSKDVKIFERVPVKWTLASILLASFALFFCHWNDPLHSGLQFFLYAVELWLLLAVMQGFGGFIKCFRSTHQNSNPVLVLHMIWMPLLAATVGVFLFSGAFIAIGAAGEIGPVVWGPPLILLSLMATVSFHIGLMGADFLDASREWLARIGGILLIASVTWAGFFLIAIYGPYAIAKLGLNYGGYATALIVFWIASTVFGVNAGTSVSSNGKPGEPEKPGIKASLVRLAPTVFMIGLLILIAGGVHYALGAWATENYSPTIDRVQTADVSTTSQTASGGNTINVKVLSMVDTLSAFFGGLFQGLAPFVRNHHAVLQYPGTAFHAWLLLFVFLGIALFLPLRININEFSIHHFYKNRLVRCYLGAGNAKDRRPNRFTGFDSNDDIKISELHSGAKQPYRGPYPIVGTTLNLNAGSELAQQERKGASFIFTPLFCGFQPSHSADDRKEVARPGSRMDTDAYIATDGYFTSCGPDIGTAMAISGAAANPSWGYHTSAPVAFLLTFFNVRLGWWIGNPRIRPASQALERFTPSRRPGPMYGFLWLIWELLGQTTGRSKYVNLSDGGHFDNLGLYELIRRRCRFIIVGDGEQDGNLSFESLGGAIRKCRADFGVEIDIDIEPIHAKPGSHCIVGTITYPEIEKGDQAPLVQGGKVRSDEQAKGWLVYFKASLTGDEPEDVEQYHAVNGDFPHQSTLNQFFTESQFESYRRLGQHMVERAFENIDTREFEKTKIEPDPPDVPPSLNTPPIPYTPPLDVFQKLAAYWYPASNINPEAATLLANAYSDLMRVLAKDPDLAFLDAELLNAPAVPVAMTPAIERKAYFFSLELIQLMENVWSEFGMDSELNRNNPKNGGWMKTFRIWKKSPTVMKFWEQSYDNYNRLFQKFFDDLRD